MCFDEVKLRKIQLTRGYESTNLEAKLVELRAGGDEGVQSILPVLVSYAGRTDKLVTLVQACGEEILTPGSDQDLLVRFGCLLFCIFHMPVMIFT